MAYLVLSRHSQDVSFGPFEKAEADRFAARNDAYYVLAVEALQRDMYSALAYGLEYEPSTVKS